jgi:predicted XRE-type DNA-binding protein
MNINKEIKELILKEGVKQDWIASKFGVTKQTVSNWVNKEDMKFNTAQEVLGLLGYEFLIRKKED